MRESVTSICVEKRLRSQSGEEIGTVNICSGQYPLVVYCVAKGTRGILSLHNRVTKGSLVPVAGQIPPRPIRCQGIRRRDGSRLRPAALAPSSAGAARTVATASGTGQ